MINFEFSAHSLDMLKEREIKEEWVDLTLKSPDKIENREDGTTHFIKSIFENGGRFLRVITNQNVNPNKVVTLFFDRNLRKQNKGEII